MSDNSNRQSADWSARHVRLRFELILTASLIAAYTFYGAQLKSSALLPVDFSKVPVTVQLLALYAFYFYTLCHFAIRTETERRDIWGSLSRVDQTIARITSTREALHRQFDPYRDPELSDRLRDWSSKLRNFGEQSAAYKSNLEQVKEKLQQMQEFLNNFPDGGRKGLFDPERESFRRFLHEAISDNENVLAINLANNSKGDTSIQEIRRLLEEMRTFIDSRFNAAIDKANASLIGEVGMLKKINRDFLLGRTAFAWERMWASCWIPALVSVILVASSLFHWARVPPGSAPEMGTAALWQWWQNTK